MLASSVVYAASCPADRLSTHLIIPPLVALAPSRILPSGGVGGGELAAHNTEPARGFLYLAIYPS
jgi:hypothetical protein